LSARACTRFLTRSLLREKAHVRERLRLGVVRRLLDEDGLIVVNKLPDEWR